MACQWTMTPNSHNITSGLVAGQWYRAIILGSPFDFWVCRKLDRSQARAAALIYAGKEIYGPEDIDSVRALRRPPTD